jgi:hypothetical protein
LSSPEPTVAEALSLAEFLETTPPSQQVAISKLTGEGKYDGKQWQYSVLTPEIQLHCSDDACNGTRFFRFDRPAAPVLVEKESRFFYLHYRCSNCQRDTKVFSLVGRLLSGNSRSGICYKLGELPVYGPPTPSRLISLIGPDREIFLKGRRCENQGLGIGAFVYYRRVVENQKNRILGEIIKASEKLHAPPELIAILKSAQTEQQFKKAVESVKDALPQVLLINGQNPLTLLHSALSEGLHAQSDEQCLELAPIFFT